MVNIRFDNNAYFFTSRIQRKFSFDPKVYWWYEPANYNIKTRARLMPIVGPKETLDQLSFPEVVDLGELEEMVDFSGYMPKTSQYYVLNHWLGCILAEIQQGRNSILNFKDIVPMANDNKVRLEISDLQLSEFLLINLRKREFWYDKY